MSTNTKSSNEEVITTSETVSLAASNIIYNEGTIILSTRGEKFSTEVKRSFVIEDPITSYKVQLKWITMHELMELDTNQDKFSSLVRNGWEADGKMSAGVGIAVKIEKDKDFYNCTFFEGESGKSFDKDKIQRRTYIKLKREHLGAIFTFIRFDEKAVQAKAEALKIKRTTLDLG